jgi:hypothetical protein
VKDETNERESASIPPNIKNLSPLRQIPPDSE